MTDLNDRATTPPRHVPAASRGAVRRRRADGGRHREVKLRFTEAEYDVLAARAADAKVSLQRYLTDDAFSRRPTANAAVAAELAGLRRLMSNLANNINQIARRLNSGGRPDPGVPAALAAVRRAAQKLENVLAWIGAPHPLVAQPSPSAIPRSTGTLRDR
jgi:hypothetical protein